MLKVVEPYIANATATSISFSISGRNDYGGATVPSRTYCFALRSVPDNYDYISGNSAGDGTFTTSSVAAGATVTSTFIRALSDGTTGRTMYLYIWGQNAASVYSLLTFSSASATLTYTDAVTDPPATIGASNGTVGNPVTVKLTCSNSNYRHTVTWDFGGLTGTLAEKTANMTLSLPTDCSAFGSKIPNGMSGTLCLRCDSYYNDSLVGTTYKNITLTMPQSAIPTASLSCAQSSSNGAVNSWGVYVQGYSKAIITVTAAGVYGSTISSTQYYLDGVQLDSAQTPVFATAGNKTVSVKVTDSRGLSAETSTSITVLPYSEPKITDIQLYRCTSTGEASSSGTYLYCKATASIDSVDGNNEILVFGVTWKASGASASVGQMITSGTAEVINASLDVHTVYNVEFELEDILNDVFFDADDIGTEIVVLNAKPGGKSIGIGMYVTSEADNTIHMGMNTVVHGTLKVGDTTITGAQLQALLELL